MDLTQEELDMVFNAIEKILERKYGQYGKEIVAEMKKLDLKTYFILLRIIKIISKIKK